MLEPLQYLYKTYGFDKKNISNIIVGQKNCAVKLHNGNIGVCATLKMNIKIDFSEIKEPNFQDNNERIFLAAYYNALLNYNKFPKSNFDIVDFIDFKRYKNLVMIGNFRPIAEKFQKKAIKVDIFDYLSCSENIIEQKEQKKYLQKSDAVILTATSIFNNTFLYITESSSNNCDIFILGPSSLVHTEMFKYKNIKAVFGTIFKNNDNQILEIVRNGGGTREYMKFAKKVVLTN